MDTLSQPPPAVLYPEETPVTPSESAAETAHPSVVAVIVAYNRKVLLLEALEALAGADAAADRRHRHRQPLRRRLGRGGSRGVAGDRRRPARPQHRRRGRLRHRHRRRDRAARARLGLGDGRRHHPDAHALEELLEAADRPGVRALAGSRVVWTDGRDHPMNTPRASPSSAARRRRTRPSSASCRCARRRSCRCSSPPRGCASAGLPIADYFLWNDDFEFSTRMLRRGRGLYVPPSVVVHKTKRSGRPTPIPGARFFFEVRNKIWLWSSATG